MYIKHHNRTVGTLRNDRVFITHREERHIFRNFNGLGLSYDVIRDLRHHRCRMIIFLLHKEDGTTKKYWTTPETLLDKGITWLDLGKDNQRILPFKYMNQTKLT